MRWIASFLTAVVFAFAVVGCSNSSSDGMSTPAGQKKYVCSMDGGTRETPGPCPKCGMTLPEKK